MYDRIPGEFVYGNDVYVDDYYMDEVWEHIPGFSNYMISSKGRVWSERSQMFLTPKRMDREGHLGFCLRRNGMAYYVYLHRLMAQAFIPNPEGYPVVRHLDDDRENNDLENLAWGTQRHNWLDSFRNGTAKAPTDEDREKGFKKIRIPVRATNIKTGETIDYPGQSEAARQLGLEQANVWKVLNGERAHTGGWFFEYLRKENSDGDN